MSTRPSLGLYSGIVEQTEAIYIEKCPSIYKRQVSTEHNVAMRRIIKSWASLSDSPPGCQSVMYSSWSRFSSNDVSTKSIDEMKASVLWSANAIIPDYNPPILERTNLMVDRPELVKCGKPRNDLCAARRYVSSKLRSSWSTTSSDSEAEKSEGVTFKRQPIRSASTASLLSASFKSKSIPTVYQQRMTPAQILAKEKGQILSASMLPSAFDSESEDEEDAESD
jgi:hypothetical protein